MRLKSIRIFGFKTFADRTELSLEGDVIAVVGPNGCGKSNLVDAILWGLGEGSARHLRAQSGQDVIFNGSARRKGVGYAEVQLVFDNEDGSLPVETPEVSLSRRLNRAGESEYAINRQTCRQRDVYELLADSGLGRAGYAIVGQKEIDQALNASAEDRRGWIDEAAGVQRYRQRKVESHRRLTAAREHLQRVTDILTELETQREPLKEEAEVAARYRSLQATLREVEVGYLVNDALAAADEQRRQEERISKSLEVARKESEDLSALERELKAGMSLLDELDEGSELLQQQKHEALRSLERAEGEARLGRQQLESLDERERSLTADLQELAARVKEAEIELEAASREADAEAMALAELQDSVAGIGTEAQLLTENLKEAERRLTEARKKEAERLRLEVERTHRQERTKLARRELSTLLGSLPDLEEGVTAAESAAIELRARAGEAEERIRTADQEIVNLRREEEEEAKTVRASLAERAALEGRKRGIEATIDSYEGLAQGAKAVLEAARHGILEATYLPVAQAIEVGRELAVAIETALGGAANDLIVGRESDAKAAIAWLKENRTGRATFQPVPLMRTVVRSDDLLKLLADEAVLGIASELVECEPANRPVIDSLLGRVLVVSDLDNALRLAKTSGWSKLVTLEGELVRDNGAVTGGFQARQAYGMVQRRADLIEIEREIAKIAKTIDGFAKRSENRTRRIEEADARRTAETAAKVEVESELKEAESFLRALMDELKATVKDRERLERELASVAPAEAPEPVDVAACESARDDALRALAAKSADAEQSQERLREAETRAMQASERRVQCERRLGHARASVELRGRRAENIEPERRKINDLIQRVEADALRLRSNLERLDAELAGKHEARAKVSAEQADRRERAEQARKNLEAISAASHQAELNRTRAEARKSAALMRLLDEYGLSGEEVEAQRDRHEPPKDAPSIVQRLRREMRAMGEVNLGAVEAYERLTVRFDELESQRDDVLGGIAEVEATIRELDKLTRDRFVMTFDQVGAAFAEMFERLFGGGEGRLVLTEPDNVLDSGIEIEVTLPGKRRQLLNLLSGGERALCTCAFLFALLKVKPSPLVILDEIDAPLDGRNVERFSEVLLEFTDRSQFIVVTHNPVTIAAAPVWIGVSMEEPGVSKLLPVKAPPGDGRSELATSLVG